jgi:hypothetical protein
MSKRLLLAVFAMTLLAGYNRPGPASDNRYPIRVGGAAFTGLAINAARTFDAINVGGWKTVLIEIQHTWSSATHVTMTCEQSPDALATVPVWLRVPECDNGTNPNVDCRQRLYRWITGGASANFLFEVPVRYRYLRCTVHSVAGAAGDLATVTATVGE